MSTTSELAGKKEWIALAVLALPTMLISMDISVLYLAIPHISAALDPSSSQLLWILDVYGFLVAGFLITMGTLGDRIGRRRLLMFGAAAFGIASILAAYSTSSEMLIFTRALLGIAGATLMPSTMALIRNMFHNERQRNLAIGVWMTSFMVGMVIGPLVGGALLENFWWGSVFLVAVPAMVLLLATGPVLLPEHKDPNPGTLDLTSVLLSIASVIGIIYSIKELAKDGMHTTPVATLLIGAALGVVFILRQKKLKHPLIDLTLFRNVKFSGTLAVMMITMMAMGGLFLLLAQYLQLVLGLSAFEAGLWTLPQAGAMVLGNMIVGAISQRMKPAHLMVGGLVVSVIGMLMFTQLSGEDDLALIVTGMVVFSIGLSPMFVVGMGMIIGAVDPAKAGVASAISETGQEFSIAFGVAIMGSVGTAVYGSQVKEELPDETPQSIVDVASDTLSGAVQVASGLPVGGEELVTIAHEAFTRALHVNSVIAAAMTALSAVLVFVLLRHMPAPSSQDAEATEESAIPEAPKEPEKAGV